MEVQTLRLSRELLGNLLNVWEANIMKKKFGWNKFRTDLAIKETDPNFIRAHEKAQKFIKEHPNVPVVDVPPVDCGDPQNTFGPIEGHPPPPISVPTESRQHSWKCVAPENAYYRWQCQNPGCSETAPYPSETFPNSSCPASSSLLPVGRPK